MYPSTVNYMWISKVSTSLKKIGIYSKWVIIIHSIYHSRTKKPLFINIWLFQYKNLSFVENL